LNFETAYGVVRQKPICICRDIWKNIRLANLLRARSATARFVCLGSFRFETDGR
jgi:hypothetical protein